MDCKRIAAISILTSLCVGIQLAPRPPNIELTSFICFLTGFLFGSIPGLFVGTLTMFLNGFLSTYGFAGTVILPFQIIGMGVIGLAGGVYRKSLGKNLNSKRQLQLEICSLASFLTVFYDLITNMAFAVQFGVNFLLALVMGSWFMALHNISNIVVFGAAFLPLTKIIGNLTGEKLCIIER